MRSDDSCFPAASPKDRQFASPYHTRPSPKETRRVSEAPSFTPTQTARFTLA
ncbi:hypothetical protein RISK_001201 [Rhodopirellula islandica]|uniref:Uncharacterized protein n=1 Tax=Rhodopirellula islandica TaxID=595434 RepID=A0A0J1BK57_RHOIS|nr:hypothetical protein RISK_001201 [Rhodopirellula islandica]